MKIKLVLMAALIGLGVGNVAAQEFKLAKATGTLDIREVNSVTIEGYGGSEIVFTSKNRDHDRDKDERSKGLRVVTGSGLEDNTGLGISVVDKGTTVEVRQLKKMDGPEIKIMVPKGISIVYDHSSPYGSEVKFVNIEGNLEVSTVHNDVVLDNVTGAINIKTVHGNIDATFTPAVKNNISIVSVHGHVDVSIPVSTKANVKLGTSHGEILVDPDLKIDIEHTGSMVRYSDNVVGKINGGGLSIALTSEHDNVYFRKKL
jgi:Putative adhesin